MGENTFAIAISAGVSSPRLASSACHASYNYHTSGALRVRGSDCSWIMREGFECFIFGIILVLHFCNINGFIQIILFSLILSFFQRIILVKCVFIYISIIILFDRHFNQLLFQVLFHPTNCFSVHYTFKV